MNLKPKQKRKIMDSFDLSLLHEETKKNKRSHDEEVEATEATEATLPKEDTLQLPVPSSVDTFDPLLDLSTSTNLNNYNKKKPSGESKKFARLTCSHCQKVSGLLGRWPLCERNKICARCAYEILWPCILTSDSNDKMDFAEQLWFRPSVIALSLSEEKQKKYQVQLAEDANSFHRVCSCCPTRTPVGVFPCSSGRLYMVEECEDIDLQPEDLRMCPHCGWDLAQMEREVAFKHVFYLCHKRSFTCPWEPSKCSVRVPMISEEERKEITNKKEYVRQLLQSHLDIANECHAWFTCEGCNTVQLSANHIQESCLLGKKLPKDWNSFDLSQLSKVDVLHHLRTILKLIK